MTHPSQRRMYLEADGIPGRHVPGDLARLLGVTLRNLHRSRRMGWRVKGHRILFAGDRTQEVRTPRVNPATGLAWHVSPRDGFPLGWVTNCGGSVAGGVWARRVEGVNKTFGKCAVAAERLYVAWLADRGLEDRPRHRLPHRTLSLDYAYGLGGRDSTLVERTPNARAGQPARAAATVDVVHLITRELHPADADAVRRCLEGDALPPDVAMRLVARFGADRLRAMLAA